MALKKEAKQLLVREGVLEKKVVEAGKRLRGKGIEGQVDWRRNNFDDEEEARTLDIQVKFEKLKKEKDHLRMNSKETQKELSRNFE